MKQLNDTKRMIAFAGIMLLALSLPAFAGLAPLRFDPDVTVRFDPPEKTVNVGDTFTLNLVADITPLVVGWGLDVNAVTPAITPAN